MFDDYLFDFLYFQTFFDLFSSSIMSAYFLTHLSAESVFEVKVKKRGGGLGANGSLQVELVAFQCVVHVL